MSPTKSTMYKEPDFPEDNWKHRDIGMRCSSCMWFVAKEHIQEEGKPETRAPSKGRCRKRSPTLQGFPVVFPDDWCGSHKLK